LRVATPRTTMRGVASFRNPPDEKIRAILATPRTVAVVGCSPDPSRDSHEIASLLRSRGHRIIPVNPATTEILGEICYPSLRHVPEPVEMVDVFRRSEFVGAIADDAIAIKAAILWLQLGVIDEDAAARATAAGLTVVMDRCPAIEYRRLF
jgi:predicted CoA-binding protein